MKHPRHEVLQDYFENALNEVQEQLVKDHLMNCDQCTGMLSQFAQIENKIKYQAPLEVSAKMKNKIFMDAQTLLAKKSAALKQKEERQELLSAFVQEWKDVIFPEIKIPALQVCSVSLVLIVFVIVAQMETGEKRYYKPLSTDVNIFTSHVEN